MCWPQYNTPIMQTDFLNWTFESDVEATSSVYSSIKEGEAQACSCDSCMHFLKFRDSLFPQNVLALFNKLGIDYTKEIDLIDQGIVSPGKIWYETWFDFKGFIVSGPSGWDSSVDISDDLSICVVVIAQDASSHYFGNEKPVTSLHFIIKTPL
jgi:hypothetical protein